MRRPVAGEPGEPAGSNRLSSRRRLLIGIGLVLLLAAMIATLL
jgi:hypothetical protein